MVATESMSTTNNNNIINNQQQHVNGQWKVSDLELCGAIPPHSPYGVSFHVPEWTHTTRFMNEDAELTSKLIYGYPRVFQHDFIKKLNKIILDSFGASDLKIYTFPSLRIVKDCQVYLQRHVENEEQTKSLASVRIEKYQVTSNDSTINGPSINVLLFPANLEPLVQSFWQNTGEILSSRFAAYCLRLMGQDKLVTASKTDEKFVNKTGELSDSVYNVELEVGGSNAKQAILSEAENKLKIRERVAKSLSFGNKVTRFPNAEDVYLFPTGMSSIYNSLRLSLAATEPHKSVCFGFPYKDTKKVLSQFGPGCVFYGNGEHDDIKSLETLLSKESITMLICEFPTNPLLKSPDFIKLRQLADQHNFILVLDDTLGNMTNLQDQCIADIVVTSLTKIFSGYSDVMGGSITLSPHSARYEQLKAKITTIYEDVFWCEEAAALERNSRDLAERAQQANKNGETLADFLKSHPLVKQVNYPKFNTAELYKAFQRPNTGYGSLLSIEFHSDAAATTFFDLAPFSKGPSLGTNFTLLMPYVILAHHKELDDVAKFGVYEHLVRVSVGLEDTEWLISTFTNVLDQTSTHLK